MSKTIVEVDKNPVANLVLGEDGHKASLTVNVKPKAAREIKVNVTASGGGGSSAIAKRLETARKIALVSDVTGSAYFDGSADIEIVASVNKITKDDVKEML